MEIKRVWAMPNKWTFKIKPIKQLSDRYIKNPEGWMDPFAGMYSPAEYTNDLNPECNAKHHYDAEFYVKMFHPEEFVFDGCILDPPYSYEQISRSYKNVGRKARAIDTSGNFYARIKDRINQNLDAGSIVISFGWNSCGMGKTRGFEIIEILLVCHGGDHNDTIVTIERKMNKMLEIERVREDDEHLEAVMHHNL